MQHVLMILTILSSFLTNLEEKTLQSAFTVTVAEEVNAPMNFPGEIIMQGNKFRLARKEPPGRMLFRCLVIISKQLK